MSRILPILFNTEMVRAIMDGRKTVTRRALKHPFEVHPNGFITKPKGNERLCPYEPPYQLGDILYVRETWAFLPCVECTREGTDCGRTCVTYEDRDSVSDGCFVYRADHPHPEHVRWSPSIHMSKAAARIRLKVTDVRVKRLQEMKPEDIRKEGMHLTITPDECKSQYDRIGAIHFYEEARREFSKLWNSTIKKSDRVSYGWDANPWVWVIEFELCKLQI